MTKTFEHLNIDLGYEDLGAVTTEAGRRYTTPHQNVYPSITTILGMLSEAGIRAWKKRVGEEYANAYAQASADRGELVHQACEDYLNNIEPTFPTPWIRAGFESIRTVLDAHVGKIYKQEAPLYSDHLKVAGRVDLIAEWDGVLSIIDFKTSRNHKEWRFCTSYFMQEAFYAIAWEERTGIPIRQLVTLIASDDSKYPTVYVEDRNDWSDKLEKVIHKYRRKHSIG